MHCVAVKSVKSTEIVCMHINFHTHAQAVNSANHTLMLNLCVNSVTAQCTNRSSVHLDLFVFLRGDLSVCRGGLITANNNSFNIHIVYV